MVVCGGTLLHTGDLNLHGQCAIPTWDSLSRFETKRATLFSFSCSSNLELFWLIMSSAGESRRRAEIEAKRAKLAELKKAREERTNRLQAGRSDGKSVSEVSSYSNCYMQEEDIVLKTFFFARAKATTPSSRRDLDDFVATLVGSGRGGSSSAGTRLGGVDGAATPSSPRKISGGPTTSELGESETGAQSALTTFVNRSDGEDQGIANTRANLVDSQVQTETVEVPKKVRAK